MELNDWLNHNLPAVTKSLEKINKKYFLDDRTIGVAGKEKVYQVIRLLRSALFPGVYEKYPIDESSIDIIIGNNIRAAAMELRSLMEKCLMNECTQEEKKGVFVRNAPIKQTRSRPFCWNSFRESVNFYIKTLRQLMKVIRLPFTGRKSC